MADTYWLEYSRKEQAAFFLLFLGESPTPFNRGEG
jgi:hypothetical protein